MNKKKEWIGYFLVPLGVSALFVGLGAFHRDAMAFGATLIALGSSMIGVSWKFLRSPEPKANAGARRELEAAE